MANLLEIYSDYIEFKIAGSILEKNLSNSKYRCWSIPYTFYYQTEDYYGNKGNFEIATRLFVWLGKKGSILITLESHRKSAKVKGCKLISEMKKWVSDKFNSKKEVKNGKQNDF